MLAGKFTPAKNWTILLEQCVDPCMPLLTSASAFGLGRKARLLVNGVTVPIQGYQK